jgi:translation initiation factor 2 gamma subunit (eIF-2gamma)
VLAQGSEKQGKVGKLLKNEVLMLNIGSMCTGAKVLGVSGQLPLTSRKNGKVACMPARSSVARLVDQRDSDVMASQICAIERFCDFLSAYAPYRILPILTG